MDYVKQLFILLGFAIIVMIIFNLLKIFILSKINMKVNKWLILAFALVVFFIPIFLAQSLNLVLKYLLSGLFMLLFLWFMDLTGFGARKDKKKEITIKPKAKPNRVKNKK